MSDKLAFLSAGFSASCGLQIVGDRGDAPAAPRDILGRGIAARNWPQGGGTPADFDLLGENNFMDIKLEAHGSGPSNLSPTAQSVYLGIKELFGMTAMYMPPDDPSYWDAVPEAKGPTVTFTLQIHVLKRGTRLALSVQSEWKVHRLRAEVASKLGLSSPEVALIYRGDHLTDDGKTLGDDLGMTWDSLVYALKVLPGERVGKFLLDPSALQPAYDYDLSGKKDDGAVYMRGGHRYHRPYGWQRHAVRVLGVFEDDAWLGKDGIRTESTPGEWAVSYHGTRSRDALDPILEDGMKVGPRQLYGKGIYTSPALEKVAKHYGNKFSYEGKTYQMVLQNRVDPDPEHLTIIPPDSYGTRKDFPYWISPLQDPGKDIFHVRPYGILTREI